MDTSLLLGVEILACILLQFGPVSYCCKMRKALSGLCSFAFLPNRPHQLLSQREILCYVERPQLQRDLALYMGGSAVPPNGQHLVLYGARGCGKSRTIKFLAHNTRGVVLVQVTELTTEHSIMESIANSPLFDGMRFTDFLQAMKWCSEKLVHLWWFSRWRGLEVATGTELC